MEHRSSPTASRAGGAPGTEDRQLVDAIISADEEAFVQLVHLHGPTMLRVALLYVSSASVAEEVVQETWLAVLTGIGRFEGRSSLRTWLFRILTNRAQSRAASEGRSVPFSALSDEELRSPELSVEPDHFHGSGERWADHWTSSPTRWTELPEESLLLSETIALVERAATSLPPAQQAVVTLRDVVGWDADEVCELLGITMTNQRVLLHRARAKIRKALEQHLAPS
jgi:RNA polymerase sigma-70 factor, ECF subfamily